MKHVLLLVLNFLILSLNAQTYNSYNVSLLGHLNPNGGTVTPGWAGNYYSGCWGWHQTSSNREYAIVGGSNGTYFIDVTVPTSPSVSAFVPGKTGCTWREIKTYQNYCYVVSDDGGANTFQIMDMSTLPSSVTLVHNDSTILKRGHTIWIDQNKMYIGGFTKKTSPSSETTFPMAVFSLATPTLPVLLRELSQDISPSVINYVHDMYVRNDTVYASTAYQGLQILKFNSGNNTFSMLGTYQNYTGSAYNHSSFLTQNGKHLIFCDEVPNGLPIRLVNVENFANIQPEQTFNPYIGTTPHNPYVLGNDFAVVACYHDGLMIYNISNPTAVSLAGYFDTYPQGGHFQNQYGGYVGNWGAYPFLPSGIVIASDMQNGVFVLDVTAAFNSTVTVPVGLNELNQSDSRLLVYPNPARNLVKIQNNDAQSARLEILNLLGEVVFTADYSGPIDETLDLQSFPNGCFLIRYTSGFNSQFEQLIISH
ncbi:MAG: choice-of-anchor B family protein [Bacteroidia bacterium]|nr:choice-of-anchor B family protein [Bacteroidia bacterium]